MVRVSKLSCLSWLMMAATTVDAKMEFQSFTKEDLVKYLMADNGDVEYEDIDATDLFDDCARYFTNGHSLGNFKNTTGDVDNGPLLDSDGNEIPIVPDAGIILSSGKPSDFNDQTSDGKTTRFGVKDLDNLGGLNDYVDYSVFDACWIKFRFKCTSDAYVPVVSFNYVFGSEEYYEYANTAFNDAFAFFLNGENIAKLPDSETDNDIVSINNVNYETNTKYFHGNDPGWNPDGNGPGYDPNGFKTINWYESIEADGITSKLTARGFPKTTGGGEQDWNEIKLVVADVGDDKLDSWVFLESGTFTCVDITSAPSISSAPSSSEPTNSPTAAPSKMPSQSPSSNPTKTPTANPTSNPTASPSQSPTPMPTNSPTGRPSVSAQPSLAPSSSPSEQPSNSPTVSSQPSGSPSISSQPSASPSVSSAPSDVPTISTSPSLNPTLSSKPSASPSVSSQPSASPSVSSSPSEEPTISSSPSLAPTLSSKPSTSPTVSSQPSASPSVSSSPSEEPTISSSPSFAPTLSSKPTSFPTTSPTNQPSSSPSISSAPSESPSSSPSISSSPTREGSYPPSVSSSPSDSPTDTPTKSPSTSPTKNPTNSPTDQPSISKEPSVHPSSSPSISSSPTGSPTSKPSISSAPSENPSSEPSVSSMPSGAPTGEPSVSSKPSITGSESPSISSMPSGIPSEQPSVSLEPTKGPSASPTKNPTKSPTNQPSISSAPSVNPSTNPSISSSPSVTASESPSVSTSPSADPSGSPSISSQPSASPSVHPSVSSRPTVTGSESPSISSSPSISPASIGPNVVFEDKNGNGVQDEGEEGVADVDILLYKDGTQVGETTTNQDGVYEFPNLSEGTYFISVKKDPEYTFSPIAEDGNSVSQDGTTNPVTLELGDTIDTWDVGMYLPVSLGNKVFDDLNGNAIQDNGEPGLEGVTVTLIDGSGAGIDTQLTGADGSYLFTGLAPGEYAVQFELPESYTFTPPSNLNMDIINNGFSDVLPDYASDVNMDTGITPSHVLESGDIDMTYDAAIYRPVTVTGVTWHDLNANGIIEDGEPGLEGSTIVLHNDDGEVVGMTVTDANGSYSFDGLQPDGYYISLMPPAPEYQLSPFGAESAFDPSSYMSYPVYLESGETGNTANAGMYLLATIDDWVWNDALANGIQDPSEVGFEDVFINLYDSDGNIVQTTKTDSEGSYHFDDIVPGTYEIEFLSKEDYRFTEQNAGGDDTKDSDVDLTGKAQFTISSGEEKNIAAGLAPGDASIGPNQVFEDSNGNGIQDEGESGAPDVVIHLVDDNGNRVATTTSDENGEYEFQDVPPGSYTIEVELEDGGSFSPVVEGGNQVSQVDDQPYGTSPVVELTGGAQEDTLDVGLIFPVSVGNKVWNDLNGNGLQDVNEPGMPNVTAILVDGNGNELDRMDTDENGLYLFEGLQPGTYAVKFDIPEEYLFTPPAKASTPITNPVDGSLSYADVTSDVNVETGVTDAVFLGSGEENLSFDAGIFIPVNISGTTWHDLNANGVEDEDEPGLPGSTVTLYDRDGDFVGIQITDSEGNFLFDDLPPGTYHTVLSPPSPEYLLSPKDDDNDSDFDPETFATNPITLNSGESGEGSFDAGLYLPAKIGDRVWYDTGMNGIQDDDEGPYDGLVTITLRDSLGYIVDTTSPAVGTGSYQFEGLKPGTYELMAEIDELGYVFTMQNKGNDTALDSDVNPTTGIVVVTVSSGEDNDSVDIGIMDDAPYYPDWQNDNQICTNDGFDPEWLEIQRVNYLYKNKEACCKAHFWWRITQCMQNEEFKFYKNGEICDTKIYFEDWESNSPADWTDTTQFDTLDECCVNHFWYDIEGCMERSPLMFKFEFCVDVKGLVEPQDCQSADIYANVLEDAMNAGVNLDADSVAQQDLTDANITSIGNVTLTKVQGSTVCGGSLAGQDFINDKTGIVPDIAAAAETITTVCGVITVEEEFCTQEDCLREHYQNITQTISEYVNDGSFQETLNRRAETRLPPVPELQRVSGVEGSFTTQNLLLPATITGDANMKYYQGSDLSTCSQKTFFLETETPYDTLHDCCKVVFHWDVRSCCMNGGGCPELGIDVDAIEYFPLWSPDKLCDSKPSASFDAWETTRFESLEDCCDSFFPNEKSRCMSQH